MSDYDAHTGYDPSVGWVMVDAILDGLRNGISDAELRKLWAEATPNERAEVERRLEEEIRERNERAADLRRRLDDLVTRRPEAKSWPRAARRP